MHAQPDRYLRLSCRVKKPDISSDCIECPLNRKLIEISYQLFERKRNVRVGGGDVFNDGFDLLAVKTF
jgi:hypothetical protein